MTLAQEKRRWASPSPPWALLGTRLTLRSLQKEIQAPLGRVTTLADSLNPTPFCWPKGALVLGALARVAEALPSRRRVRRAAHARPLVGAAAVGGGPVARREPLLRQVPGAPLAPPDLRLLPVLRDLRVVPPRGLRLRQLLRGSRANIVDGRRLPS